MTDLMSTQLDLEKRAVDLGVKRYRDHVHYSALHDVAPGVALMRQAILPLSAAIVEFCKPGRGGGRLGKTKSILRMLHPDKVAYLTARSLLAAVTDEAPLTRMAYAAANTLGEQIEYERLEKAAPQLVRSVGRKIAGDTEYHRRKVNKQLRRRKGIPDLEWDQEMKLAVGIKVIDLFLQTTGLLKRTVRGSGVKTQYYLEPTEELLRWLENAHARNELLAPWYLPTVVPPKPWESIEYGGYFSHKIQIIRHRRHQQVVEKVNASNADLSRVYSALNALQNTRWRINGRILQVFRDVWEQGGGIAGLPPRELMPLPPTPWSGDEEFNLLKQTNPGLVKAWKKQAADVHDQRKRDVSKRIDAVSKLYVAETFLKYGELYFPHSIDWRGRAYPVPTTINPQSDDLGKALLHFAEAKAITTPEALDWWYIHGANCYGIDKVPFADRKEWVFDNVENILASARNPLDAYEFWVKADSPWKFLAFCFEFLDFMEAPQSFTSRLPIAMDGSCNGLQHLSMLLRDEDGGASVNLVPQDKPADIYREVADKVIALVEQDAEEGDEYAKAWRGKIDRNLVKRGVMTTPYGVSGFGLREQLVAEVDGRNESPYEKYLEGDTFLLCRYLARHLDTAIASTHPASRQVMQWFQSVAAVFGACQIPMTWTTPVGWYTVQDYKRIRVIRIRTVMGGIELRPQVTEETQRIDSNKMKSGASPNIVHSLDAAHLMLTVNRCLQEDITAFAMVHDSYATHAEDAPRLAQILREEFVGMYAGNILVGLYEQFLAQLPEEKREEVPQPPELGSLDSEAPYQSAYFFA